MPTTRSATSPPPCRSATSVAAEREAEALGEALADLGLARRRERAGPS